MPSIDSLWPTSLLHLLLLKTYELTACSPSCKISPYIPQHNYTLPVLTISETFAFIARLLLSDPSRVVATVSSLLSDLNLSNSRITDNLNGARVAATCSDDGMDTTPRRNVRRMTMNNNSSHEGRPDRVHACNPVHIRRTLRERRRGNGDGGRRCDKLGCCSVRSRRRGGGDVSETFALATLLLLPDPSRVATTVSSHLSNSRLTDNLYPPAKLQASLHH